MSSRRCEVVRVGRPTPSSANAPRVSLPRDGRGGAGTPELPIPGAAIEPVVARPEPLIPVPDALPVPFKAAPVPPMLVPVIPDPKPDPPGGGVSLAIIVEEPMPEEDLAVLPPNDPSVDWG
jgi:hypothetical protein